MLGLRHPLVYGRAQPAILRVEDRVRANVRPGQPKSALFHRCEVTNSCGRLAPVVAEVRLVLELWLRGRVGLVGRRPGGVHVH